MSEKSIRIIFFVIMISVITSLCAYFRLIILENFLKPLALILYLILRTFLLPIDQIILWGIMIFAVSIIIFMRFDDITAEGKPINESTKNFYAEKYASWKLCLSSDSRDAHSQKYLKRELISMMVALYAAGKRIPVDFRLFDAFKAKEIPVPEKIHTFLYAERSHTISISLAELYNRISGHETDEYHRNLEACLLFLENYTEVHIDGNTT